ncbi:MAG: hypothetical protein HOB52_03535, partial [Euryarchaeota archaeon]|nr:hypothetical protein [Euryarchaeota archaeon]
QYAFDMGVYSAEEAKSAMSTVIRLITEQTIDGMANEFNISGGQIKFNPELPITGVGPLKKSSSDFRKLISERYYSNLVTRTSDVGKTDEQLRKSRRKELTTTIVRFYRASTAADAKSATGSRLMDPDNSLDKLATEYFGSFLEYLALNPNLNSNTEAQWEAFLKTPERQFQNCQWDLPNVSPGSTQTNRAYKASDRAAKITFSKLFSSPTDFNGIDPASWLLGPGDIQGQSAPSAARFPTTRYTPQIKSASGGSGSIHLRVLGHKMIRFRALPNSQATIVDVEMHVGGSWVSQGTQKAITLPSGMVSTQIKVTTICFSEDSVEITNFAVLS